MNNYKQWSMTCCLMVLSTTVIAGQKVDESLPASDSSLVRIEHVNGKAEILGWDKDLVAIKGELGDSTDDFTFKEKNGDIRIKVEVEKHRSWHQSDDGDDLTIYVPFGASIDYDSVNANVKVKDLRDSTRLEVVNGSIDAGALSGRVRFESVNGEIYFRDIDGSLTVETVNGDIEGKHLSQEDLKLLSVNGDIEVESQSLDIETESVNGDIELMLGDIKHFEVTTVNGDIESELALTSNADIEGSTVGGRITLYFAKPVAADFDLEAHAGGKIVNKITDDKMQKAKYGPRRWLNFSVGSGSASVNLSTVSGRITVAPKD